jgi:hypothetical protein
VQFIGSYEIEAGVAILPPKLITDNSDFESIVRFPERSQLFGLSPGTKLAKFAIGELCTMDQQSRTTPKAG